MRILVTGANGYLGSAVVRTLCASGHEVVGLVHRGRSRVPAGIAIRTADLGDQNALGTALRDVDLVCHLAGLTRVRESFAEPLDYFAVNVGGTVTLLRAMAAAGVHRLVFASTASIYGTPTRQPMPEHLIDDPQHPYAASKQAAEAVIAAQAATGRLDATVLRLFNIAGGPDPDDTRILSRILAVAGGTDPALIVNGDGTAVRDYLHRDDAARAFDAVVAGLPQPGRHRRYNIGTGVGTSVNDLVAVAARVTGRRIPVEYRAAAPEPQRLISDSRRAHAELGWSPKSSDIDTIIADAWSARSSIASHGNDAPGSPPPHWPRRPPARH
ncbi:NAD-dependent epimerase/dehydratase family protein [Nocardia nepalensis]|uniref:NAD-dependent epimerase/dehydratase family protein n=1 Tax=Nocardia nepalensis TaxID=3375448 RepID=UPI003B675EC5